MASAITPSSSLSSTLLSSSISSQASASAGTNESTPSQKPSLTMAQIAGITIAAAALLILTVGVFSCIFFVRKRNRRLDTEDQKGLTNYTPKSPEMQYFPPPPTAAKSENRKSKRFSLMSRRKSKRYSGEKIVNFGGATLEQRPWPRYYPIMPNEGFGIGIAATTNVPIPVAPSNSVRYTPSAAPVPTVVPAPVPVLQDPASARNSLASTPPAYKQFHTQPQVVPASRMLPPQSYPTSQASFSYPQPPQQLHPAYTRPVSNGSQRRSHAPGQSRQSRAFSMMTNIEEGAQISSRETSLPDLSTSSSCESDTCSQVSATPSVKKQRRPTLTINIPGAPKKPGIPPPPAGPPPSRAPSVASAAPPKTTTAPAVPHPPRKQQQPRPIQLKITAPTRPPLLRENDVKRIPNSPTDILAAATTYASVRTVPTRTSSNESGESAALPSSQALATPGTFLLSDSERNSSSRSNSSHRRPSRASKRDSDASYTSFEDDEGNESDDPTPPTRDENKRLSPVTEASPVSTLKYPKVPRGSNQTVPRSPGTPKSAGGGGVIKPQPSTSPIFPSPSRTPKPPPATSKYHLPVPNPTQSSQTIGNRLWKTELSPDGSTVKKPLPTPEWSARRRSESWQNWAAVTPDSAVGGQLGADLPKMTPTRRGDELFLEMRF